MNKTNFIIPLVVALFAQLTGLGQTSVIMQKNDLKRTGWNQSETSLKPSNVTPQTFGKVFSRTVDDQVYAQPLVISNVQIGGGTHNVLLVATVNNSVYAFDADEATKTAPYWNVNLTPSGSRPPKNTDMTGACGGTYRDFSGNIGIVGTPAIDTINNAIYLVTRNLKTDGTYQQFLHALDLRTGQEKANSPKLITATYKGNGDGSVNGVITFDSQKHNQRVALLLYNNVVYIAWASHCDWGPYHGWLIGYDATSLSQKYVYNASPEGENAGFWMSGQGPSVDDNGIFYLSTGNGTIGLNNDPNDLTNRGESLLKMTPDLKVLDFFTPKDYQYLEDYDLDYGADGVLLIPNSNYSLSGSKEAYLYMIDNTNMGKMNPNETNVLQKIDINASNPNPLRHIHGAPVYFKDSNNQEYIYVWSENGLFRQIPFNRTTMRFDINKQINSQLVLPDGMPGGFMSITSDGQNANTGIVWVSHPYQGDANQAVVPGILRAFDATDITKELWNTNMNVGDNYGSFAKFVSPTVANGKVYMATFSKVINVYGATTSTQLKDPETFLNPTNGLDYSYYEGAWSYIPKFPTLTPVKTGTTTNFLIDERRQDDNFGFEYKGYIDVPSDGYYSFYTNSDDGSRLYIGSNLIVENDGLHGAQEATGIIGLKAGKHSISVDFFEAGGDQLLTVSWSGPGITKQVIPSANLFRSAPTTNQTPYLGTAWNIPGKIEAENYDVGGEGIAYHDLTAGNSGNSYRTEDVDMEISTDINAGFNVGWTDAGEWLEYTVNVTQSGSYTLDARVAAISAGQSFHIELDGQNISGTLTVPNTGAWQNWQTVSVTTPTLTAGQKIMRIVIETGQYNINYINFSTTVKNNPPTVSITSPAANSSFNEGTVITITADAKDSDGTISKVEFFVDGKSIGVSTASPYTVNYTATAGTHTVTAFATDDKNASTTSAAITINGIATNISPTASITAPVNNATYKDGTVITISADAKDSDGSISKVEFFVDGTSIGVSTASPYTVNYTTIVGIHTLTVIATDDKNASTTSAAISIVVTGKNGPYLGTPWNIPGKIEAENYDIGGEGVAYHDLTPGNSGAAYRTEDVDMEISTDVNGGYNVGWIDAGEWLNYTVNVTQEGTYTIDARVASTTAGQKFHIELDGQNVSGTITVPNTGAWQNWQTVSVTTPSITIGQKTMKIVMETSQFNINYINFSTAVKNNPPTVSITVPSNNTTLNEGTIVGITADAKDSDGSISKVEFFVDGKSVGIASASPYKTTYTAVAGTHTLTATATDDKGTSTISSPISIVVTGNNVAPIISITSPANNTSVNAGTVLTITADAKDTDGTISKVELFVDGKSIGSATASPYSVNYTAVTGTHSITGVATDNKAATTTSTPIIITVKTNTNTCSGIPQYVENAGYVAGSKVQNLGNQYQCKPWPYSGWCNGAAWAYAPGTGSVWTDAWTLTGSCTAKIGSMATEASTSSIEVYPNPVEYTAFVKLNVPAVESARIIITNSLGKEIYMEELSSSMETNLDLSKIDSGIYIIRVISNENTWEQKFVKQ